jgi:hypothetical protein
MPVQIENFYHTFPRDFLVEIALSDGSRFPMCRRTSGVFFDCFFNVRYPRAHASTISTRSRTVHKLFATPAAIAGVHRIAMLAPSGMGIEAHFVVDSRTNERVALSSNYTNTSHAHA